MEFKQTKVEAYGIKVTIEKDGKELGRSYVYIMKNSLHERPFGLLEDVFLDEELRGQGLGKELVLKTIEAAKKEGCYKMVATSRYERPQVHKLYENLGFKDRGKEFRIDFT